MLPLRPAESSSLHELLGYLPFLRLYAHRMTTDKSLPVDAFDELFQLLMRLLATLGPAAAGPGEGAGRRHKSLAEAEHEARVTSPVELSKLYFGAADAQTQTQAKDIKVRCVAGAHFAPLVAALRAHLPLRGGLKGRLVSA